MSLYKLVYGRFREDGDLYESGDEVELADDQYDQWADRFVEVEPPEDDTQDEASVEDIAGRGAYDLADQIEAGDHDSYLDTLAEADDRKTVQDAIDDRQATLADE